MDVEGGVFLQCATVERCNAALGKRSETGDSFKLATWRLYLIIAGPQQFLGGVEGERGDVVRAQRRPARWREELTTQLVEPKQSAIDCLSANVPAQASRRIQRRGASSLLARISSTYSPERAADQRTRA